METNPSNEEVYKIGFEAGVRSAQSVQIQASDEYIEKHMDGVKKLTDDTRLERIATAVLQGLCASECTGPVTEFAEISVAQARALIAELDKEGE